MIIFSQPLVSLILVSYNSANLLPDFLAAIGATTYAPYELIVVDNASTDGTLAYLAGQTQVQVIASGANLGFGRACNIGAAAAHGDLLVFLNPDVRVTPGWLDRLVASARACPDALICPTTLYPGEQPRPVAGLRQVAAIPGAALLVWRNVWDDLGGFDQQMFMYWEDAELCWRAWLLGYRVLADLGTFVYHQRGGSAGGRRWDAERVKNSLRTYLKLMRWRAVVPFALLLAAKTLLKYGHTRDPALLAAWAWNGRMLGLTMAERRALRVRRRGDPAQLEQRVHELARRLRAERRQRSST
ncbi:MAG: glycosyltransferase family 2 protein [Roseiflexaceae bacterium]|nr:glycosyltransferase family 2 protein [Roseiflexaceae bacterium]